MSRESMRKPEMHSVATFSIVIPGSEILRWFKPQNVGTMVIAQVVPILICVTSGWEWLCVLFFLATFFIQEKIVPWNYVFFVAILKSINIKCTGIRNL